MNEVAALEAEPAIAITMINATHAMCLRGIVDLPRGPKRELVRERDRDYEINGCESRMLVTVGAFRVVLESDLYDARDKSQETRRSLRHLEREGLIRTSPLSSDDRAVTLTERGRDLLEANRYDREDRSHEPRQEFYAGLKKPRIVNGLHGHKLTTASINRTLGLLRHMLNWAVGREYLDRTPFRRGTEVLVRMELEDDTRRRRVPEEEEAALLAVASPHLRSMIIAALDTGMRRGEMLALRFEDIDPKRRMITLRGATTKSRKTRVVPIGTARLMAVLEWLRLDGNGERKGADVPVFSNEAGEPLKTFEKAWVVAVLTAHGVDPRWRKGS